MIYDLRNRPITSEQLLKAIQAGDNITITKIDECTIEISSNAESGDGLILWRLRTGDDFTIPEYKEYNVCGKFVIDDGVVLTIDSNGRLCVICGDLQNEGEIINNGEIKFAV